MSSLHSPAPILALCAILISGCAATPRNGALSFSSMTPQPLPAPPLPQRHIAAEEQEESATDTEASADIWSHLRKGYALPNRERAEARAVARRHAAHPAATRNTLRRAEPYLWEIIEQVEARQMPLEIALLPAIETRFNPKAQSPRGAAGLWQFLPKTGALYGLQQDWWHDARLDTVESTRAALDYLTYLHGRYDDWLLALAAYNAGEARVMRAIKRNRKAGKPADYWHISLPEETRQYVPRLLGLARLIERPDDFGFLLPQVADANEFTVVRLKHQLDLTLAAELSDLPLTKIQRYNPALRHWMTGPQGPQQLILPKARGEQLRKALAGLPADSWMTWERYRIRRGDNLGAIAQRYGSTVSILRRINELKSDYLRAGNSLLVPVPRHTGQLLAAGLAVPPALQQPSASVAVASNTMAEPGIPSRIRPEARAGHRGTVQIRYQIQTGDSLAAIARAYEVSLEALAGWNNLDPGSILRPGRMLTIWTGRRSAPDVSGQPF